MCHSLEDRLVTDVVLHRLAVLAACKHTPGRAHSHQQHRLHRAVGTCSSKRRQPVKAYAMRAPARDNAWHTCRLNHCKPADMDHHTYNLSRQSHITGDTCWCRTGSAAATQLPFVTCTGVQTLLLRVPALHGLYVESRLSERPTS